MGPIWGGEPPRETHERTRQRLDAQKAVISDTKDYKNMIKSLKGDLDNRGPQEWTAVPRPSNETIQRRRKAAGIAALTAAKEEYEAILEGVAEREHIRTQGERREMRKACREADLRLSNE